MQLGTECLVKIATRQRTWLVDPLAVRELEPPAEVLNGLPATKVVHDARLERHVRGTLGLALDGVFDTREVSRRARGGDGEEGQSLAAAWEREIGVVLQATLQGSNWSRRPLEALQPEHAAQEAEALLALHERLAKPGA